MKPHLPSGPEAPAPGVLEVLDRMTRILDDLGLPYAVVGSIAMASYGYRRRPADVDIIMQADPERTAALLARIKEEGFEFILSREGDFLREGRISLFERKGFGVGLSPAGTRFPAQVLSRRAVREAYGRRIPVASLEDLLLIKLFLFRFKDRLHLLDFAADLGNLDGAWLRAQYSRATCFPDLSCSRRGTPSYHPHESPRLPAAVPMAVGLAPGALGVAGLLAGSWIGALVALAAILGGFLAGALLVRMSWWLRRGSRLKRRVHWVGLLVGVPAGLACLPAVAALGAGSFWEAATLAVGLGLAAAAGLMSVAGSSPMPPYFGGRLFRNS